MLCVTAAFARAQFIWNSLWKQPVAKCEVQLNGRHKGHVYERLHWLMHVVCMVRENVGYCFHQYKNTYSICMHLLTFLLLTYVIWPGHLMIQNWHYHILYISLLSNFHFPQTSLVLDPLWQGLYQWQESLWQVWWWKLWHVSMVAVQRGVTGLDRTVYPVSWDSMSALCVTFPQGHSWRERDTKTTNVLVRAYHVSGQ